MTSDRISRRTLLQASLASTCTLTVLSAISATTALKGLQIVVPAPPGSQPDVIARWLVDPLARKAGVVGTVLNVPGAAGALAVDAVLRAPSESGPVLLGGLDHVAYSHLNSNRRALDPLTDFVPVAAVNRDTWVVAVSSESPSRGLQALADRSRREPLSYASTGEGSTAHLLSARVCKALSIDAQHVPYRDPWMADLIAGRIHFVVAPTPALLPQLRAGRVLAVATLTDERLALPGDPPTVRELGTPDLVFYGGLFLFGPSSMAPLAQQLNAWFRETVGTADMLQRYRDASIEATPLDLDATVAMVRQRLQTVDAMRLAVFGRSR